MDRNTPFVIVAILGFALAACTPTPKVETQHPNKAPYTWKVTRVLDGDTVEVDAKFFPPELGHIKVRIEGIDTPESGGRAKCDSERDRAKVAKKFAQDKLMGRTIVVSDVKPDKYGGRIVGEITVDGKPYRAMMIDNQLAKSYDGGTKQSWCKL